MSKPLQIDLPLPVSGERPAANAIRELGGWYELDGNGRVIELNMVYFDKAGQRLDNDQLTDEALSHVTQFPHLKRLYLKETQASNEGLRFVAELPELEELLIWDGAGITDEGISHLRKLPKLKFLHLNRSAVTDEALAYLSEIPSIETLSMQHNAFTDKAFEYAKRLPRLKKLIIDYGPRCGPRFTDEGMKHVGEMQMLEELWLQGDSITDNGLREVFGLKNLKFLLLDETTEFHDAMIIELQAAIPGLKVCVGTRIFPTRNAIRDAADPVRKELNRKEAPQGLKTIERFLELISTDQDVEAACLCHPDTIAELREKQKSEPWNSIKICAAYGDADRVLAVTTAKATDSYVDDNGEEQFVRRRYLVLNAVKEMGKWCVEGHFKVEGSDSFLKRYLSEHVGAEPLSPSTQWALPDT